MNRSRIAAAMLLLTLAASAPGHAQRITEDDPRWNCATMGNHICGHMNHPLPDPLLDPPSNN